jgi:hypothetical protein
MSVNPYESSRVPTPSAVQPLELPVRIEHEATLDDYVEFYVWYQNNLVVSRVMRLLVPGLGILMVLAMLVVAVVKLVSSPQGPDDEQVAGVIAAAGAVVVIVPLCIGLAWWQPTKFLLAPYYRHFVSRGDPAVLLGPRVLTITAEHLIEQGPKSEQRFALSSVQKIVVTPRHIFLFLSTLQGIGIPLRSLADTHNPAALVVLLERLTSAKVVRG